MPAVQKRTFNLAVEDASYIDKLVSSGAYESDSEVVVAGLQALQDRDVSIEDWLREEVVPVYDAMKADPSRGIPAEQVFKSIHERHAERIRAESHGEKKRRIRAGS